MKRYNKKEYTDARKRIRSFIKKHNRLPNYCAFVTNEKKTVDLNKEEYCGLFEGYMHFCLKNGREPNYLTLTSKASNPIVVNYQDDKVSCCPASFLMAMMFLFEYKSEATVKKLLGTNSNGTSPSQLISNAGRLGYVVKRIPREFREVKKALEQYKPVLMHIQTKPATCLGFVSDYGHWIICWKVKDNKYYVIDPTKGSKVCNYQVLNRATNGRNIGYYSVEIK